jgi:hypothetical protein
MRAIDNKQHSTRPASPTPGSVGHRLSRTPVPLRSHPGSTAVRPPTEPRHTNRRPPTGSGGLRPWYILGLRVPAVLAMAAVSACESSPVDCSKIDPVLCDSHPECSAITVYRLDEQCVGQSRPVACRDLHRAFCQLQFYVRDPNRTCWLAGECFIPPGWTLDEGVSCLQYEGALYDSCFPDAGASGAPAVPDAGAP